jgi:glycerate kinase
MKACVQKIFPESNCIEMPFSDGGEGALSVLEKFAQGKIIHCTCTDALKRPIKAPYFAFNDGKSVWIELSQTAGLTQLLAHERNPMITSTWGTGLMIRHAISNGFTKIFLGIGGSATHDLGTGIVAALGGCFLNPKGEILPLGGGALRYFNQLDRSALDTKISETQWVIACDVLNPLIGPEGAAHTYAQQKGASADEVEQLEAGSQNVALKIFQQTGVAIETLEGGGAAGGVSAGLYGMLNARIRNGFELLSEKTPLKKTLQSVDLVLTGEGHFDGQSRFGKLPFQVAQLTLNKKIPTLIFAGKTSLEDNRLFPHVRAFQTTPKHMRLEDAMKNAQQNLEEKLYEVLSSLKNNFPSP